MNPALKALDAQIEVLLADLAKEDISAQGKNELHAKLNALLESRQYLYPINPNTVLLVAANLLGIAVVLSYEKLNIITSKAFGQIMRPR